jgi:hypothetical protein
MLSDNITDEQKANRKILRDAMEKEDFVWYRVNGGTIVWRQNVGCLFNQKECFYGPIEL